MTSLNKNKDFSCSQIESLLIKNNFESLALSEQKTLNDHLGSCSSCKKYRGLIDNLRTIMKTTDDSIIKPDPIIKKNIINKMRSLKNNDSNYTKKVARTVWNIFDYRIPVYQAFSFFVIIVLVLFGLNSLYFSNIGDSMKIQGLTNFEETISTFVDTTDSLHRVDSQKIGRNFQEDSLLIRFIVTSM